MCGVADLVILMIDASYGFEMETFEFLKTYFEAILFPVVGVLTHLDAFKQSKLFCEHEESFKESLLTKYMKGARLPDLFSPGL